MVLLDFISTYLELNIEAFKEVKDKIQKSRKNKS